MDAFCARKTFLAVKGCYERNFVVFKQIYAFETFTSGMQQADVDSDSEVDRLRSTNAEFTPLVRQAFMWATYLHGSWTTGTVWDGMRHSILGKSLLSIKKTNKAPQPNF